MAISYTTPDGTVVTTVAQLATWYYAREGIATPTNGELIVFADRKPGTPTS